MSIISSLMSVVTGSVGELGKTIIDTAKEYIPSAEKKVEFEILAKESQHRIELESQKLAFEAEKNFNKRIAEQEGTAKDLKAIPVLGHIILFLRGAQRPIWGFFAIFASYQYLTGSWLIEPDSVKEKMLFFIIVAVIVFLFSERGIKNVLPLVMQLLGKKDESANN